MQTQLARTDYNPVVTMVLNTVASDHTKRAYRQALEHFLVNVKGELNRVNVMAYKATCETEETPASIINQRLTAIKALAREAAANGLLTDAQAYAIATVKGIAVRGGKAGNWLDKGAAEALVNAPDTTSLTGLRDRALLAVLIGGGLRRAEVAALTVGQLQQRDGRWVLLDVLGKGNKVRTIPIPAWVAQAIAQWTVAASLTDGFIFRQVRRGGHVQPQGLTEQTILDVVAKYAPAGIKPHDLRRTFASLARKGGAPVEMIQDTLGHESIATTQRYLKAMDSVTVAAADFLGMTV